GEQLRQLQVGRRKHPLCLSSHWLEFTLSLELPVQTAASKEDAQDGLLDFARHRQG
ncbi:hypothetical protein ABG768_016048, partial [Culter alburnus]